MHLSQSTEASNFYWHRESLNDLSRLAWETLKEFMTRTLEIDGTPASIQAIETAGEYHDLNPHVHAVVADGLFLPDGTFHFMPRYDEGARIFLKSLWERNISSYCQQKGFVKKENINRILSQHHSGFSVFAERSIKYSKYKP